MEFIISAKIAAAAAIAAVEAVFGDDVAENAAAALERDARAGRVGGAARAAAWEAARAAVGDDWDEDEDAAWIAAYDRAIYDK